MSGITDAVGAAKTSAGEMEKLGSVDTNSVDDMLDAQQQMYETQIKVQMASTLLQVYNQMMKDIVEKFQLR